MRTHGLSGHPLYVIWKTMKARCYYKSRPSYHRYGGRGIAVCDEWREDAKAFIDWATENGWEQGKQLDRIDNDSNYSPDNCRFVSARENCANRRDNTRVVVNGESMIVAEASRQTGVPTNTILNRLKRGLAPDSPLIAYRGKLPAGSITPPEGA